MLDTGFDLAHPDFAGRNVTAQSFVAGEAAQDGHGHGTHCIGTSCGPRTPSTGPRYGVAYEAEIFAGKVLSNAGSGSDAQILAGINWAVTNGCPVLSMSLGADVQMAHPPYSAAGARALEKGCLIIAAAGNNADRRAGNVGFVGAPANSPEIMAVGALEQQLGMAFFSARSLPARGGQVDIAGPGFQVLLLLAAAHAVPDDQRHQHGHAARGRGRGAVGRGHRAARAGAVGHPLPGEPAAAAAVGRRRQRDGLALRSRARTSVSDMVQISVTVDDAHAIEEVAAGLRARGMEVAEVLDGIGMITGSVPDEARDALAGVEGVASVDEQLTHQLPPPDADVQ